MKLIRIIIPFLFLISDSCIERYDLPEKLSSPKLVVDGMITNGSEPATVRLYQSFDIDTRANEAKPVSKAVINIYDDAGASEQLIETSPGVYQTTGQQLKGQVGRKYHIEILTNEKKYVSQPQEMFPAGSIDDAYYVLEENSINPTDISEPQNAMTFYVDASGVQGYPNLFRWRWSSIYEVHTYPELKTMWAGKPPVEIPTPLPCSGFVPGGGGIVQTDVCTCCNCWVPEAGDRAIISNNQFISNDVFRNVFIARMPIDEWRFNIKYRIKVDQLSLSEDVYAFWKLIKAQQEGEGSLFQPNAIKIKGNIQSITNPDEEVLGIFSVSAITTKELFIERKQIPIVLATDTVKGSCLGQFKGSSNVKPPFW